MADEAGGRAGMAGRRHGRPVLAIALLLAAAACGAAGTTSPAAPRPAGQATGALTVFAAASLAEAFTDLKAALASSVAGLPLTYSFAGSASLVTQIQQGAPADVVATADTATMMRLTDAGLVEPPVTFARNRLEILVAPGNPKAVAALADLARPDLQVVLADESVPVGRYAAQALRASGTIVRPVSRETDVKAAAAKVALGEADATIVYATDVLALGSRGRGLEIPPAANVVAEYPIAVVRATKNLSAARAFLDTVVNGAGQDALRRRGFSSVAGAR